MIDLHMHTTASDGRHSPEELVERVRQAGITTMSVTDHDTMAAIAPTTEAARPYGITVVPGIEITSVHAGKDVHVLAYYLPPTAPGLEALLSGQRQLRLDRAMLIAERLAAMGAPIDEAELVAAATAPGGKAIARPQIAQLLIAAGHVASVPEAFDRYLGEDSPAYVPHTGATPAEVVELVTRGGGAASLAHPGYRQRDEIIPGLVEAGLTAIEAFHSSHDDALQAHYLQMAADLGVAVTGGSDFHGEGTRRSEFFGVLGLPQEHFDRFVERAQAAGVAAR